jgi:predicted dehydrogenase
MTGPDRERRQFIRRTAAGVGAALAAQLSAAPETARAQADRKLNIALVGLGSLSTNQIAPALMKTRHARLAGIVTGSPDKAARWMADYGLDARQVYDYDSMDRLGDDPEIDAVYIVTPNGLHAEHTIRAARAGKHVLCEKPMANTAADGRDMIAACAQARVRLAVGYRCRFEPHHLECLRLAREREFGEIRHIEAGFGFRIGDPRQWRLRKDLAGGGALMDVGIYALQSCRMLTGEEPEIVSAIEAKTDTEKFAEVDESILWQMRFPSGVTASCSTTYNANGINRFRVVADRGWFGMDPAYSYTGLAGATSRGPLAFPAIDQFAAEIDDFALGILEGRESIVPGEEGLRDLLAIEAIYESIRSGRATAPA